MQLKLHYATIIIAGCRSYKMYFRKHPSTNKVSSPPKESYDVCQ